MTRNPHQPGGSQNPYGAPQTQNRLLTASLEARLPPEKLPQPPSPRWAMVLGVFTFPFTNGDVLLRLVGISVCLSFSGLMFVMAMGPGGQIGGMALRPLGQAFLMSFILTMGYAAAQSSAIVRDTAEGLEEVYNWPAFEWRDWALAYYFVIFVGVAALMVGYGAWAATLYRAQWLWPVVTYLAFPIMLMSALEGDSPFNMLSLPVLRSLKTTWWAWCLFYLESGLLLVGWLIVAVLGLGTFPYYTIPITATGLAIVVLIYARLLGRLAWCISMSEPETEEE